MNFLRNTLAAFSFVALGATAQAQDLYASGEMFTPRGGMPAVVPVSVPAGTMGSPMMAGGGPMVWTGGDCNSCGSGTGQCGPTSCNWSCDSGCKSYQVGIFGEFLYLQMHDADIAYAHSVDGLGEQQLPTGTLGVLRPRFDPGWKVGFWFSASELFSVRASYLSWTSNATDRVFVPEGDILFSLVTHPNSANFAEDSLEASAFVNTKLTQIDLDGVIHYINCKSFTLNGVVGARYADLRQQFHGTFLIAGQTDVITQSRFTGIGPRVGLESEYVSCNGLGVYAKGSLNLLLGDFNNSYLQLNVFQGTLADARFKTGHLTVNSELEIGGSWTGMDGHVRVSGGYLVSGWRNAVSTNSLVRGVQTNNFTNATDNIVFDGFVLRLEARF